MLPMDKFCTLTFWDYIQRVLSYMFVISAENSGLFSTPSKEVLDKTGDKEGFDSVRTNLDSLLIEATDSTTPKSTRETRGNKRYTLFVAFIDCC